ncbi:MAG: 3,4-dihydroxy-2-butanone-4-phosphate synthase [Mycobacterium sp.]
MTMIGTRWRTPDADVMVSAPVDAAVHALSIGHMVVVVDDESDSDEGDLVIAAAHATPQRVAFMMRHTGGILCVPMPASDLDRLCLPPMVATGEHPHSAAHTVSVNARAGIASGNSATDRSRTISLLADAQTQPQDLSRPGHVFPLRTVDGGVLRRAGHAEAAVDLVRMAGLPPAAVLGGVVDDDGEVAKGNRLRAFVAAHRVPVVGMAELIAYRRRTEQLVEFKAATRLPTRFGEFRVHGFRSVLDDREHIALVMGDPADHGASPILVRVHSECLLGNAFGSRLCDCGDRLDSALQMIADEGRGVVVYLRGCKGSCRGLLAGSASNPEGAEAPDRRDYGVGAQILADLGVRRMRLMTNSPVKRIGLDAFGLEVTGTKRLPSMSTS